MCYKEANPDQFDAFVDEVQQEGRLTGETKELLEKLEKDPEKKEELSKEEVRVHVALSFFRMYFPPVHRRTTFRCR